MKLQFKKRRLIPVALAILVLVVGSGVAYAFWTTTASGSGAAAAATGVPGLAITQSVLSADALSPMYPGDAPQIIKVTITNNSAQSAYVTSVSASVDSTSSVGCHPADFTVGAAAAVGVDIPGTSNITVPGPTIQFNNTVSNQDACKGVTVFLAFSAS